MVVGYSVGGGVTDMDPYHMLPTPEVQRIIAGLPEDFQDIVLELRSLIVSVAPGATETRHRSGFTHYFAERGGPVSASLCQIIWLPEQIWLAFNHGAFLPDPRHLLTGPAKYKRFVRLPAYARVPWADLKALIACAALFDPNRLRCAEAAGAAAGRVCFSSQSEMAASTAGSTGCVACC